MPEMPDRRVLGEAADWFALLNSGRASEADQQRWRAWLGLPGSPQSRAWERVQTISDQFSMGRKPAARAALQVSMGRRHALRSLAIICGAGAGAWMAINSSPWQTWTADYHSRVGDVHEIALPDGTRVWLNTDSAFNLRYTDTLREVQLARGEIHLLSASPAGESRPLVITTRHGAARALGTRYTVRLLDAHSEVSVFEGSVALQPADTAQAALIAQAGSRAFMTRTQAVEAGAADMARRDWTRGLIIANNMPLADFIAELSRYRRGYLGCAPEVAQLRLVGAFPAHDTEAALAMMARTLPVEVRRRSDWWVTVVPRQSGAGR